MSATSKPHYVRMLDAPRSVWLVYELRSQLRVRGGDDREFARLVDELVTLLDPDGEHDPDMPMAALVVRR